MADKKKKPVAKKSAVKKTTTKRRTAIPISAARTTTKTPVMRVVAPQVEAAEPPQEEIARRAFENWMLYVRLANDPVANWLEAEQQLRRELNPQ
jgi:hypothetical protein